MEVVIKPKNYEKTMSSFGEFLGDVRLPLSALNSHNRLLGRLSEILGCGCKLTSYTSRHSWATAARNHNVPISVISQGMGHTSEQTTHIYLTMLENSVIDDANKGIIGELL